MCNGAPSDVDAAGLVALPLRTYQWRGTDYQVSYQSMYIIATQRLTSATTLRLVARGTIVLRQQIRHLHFAFNLNATLEMYSEAFYNANFTTFLL